MRRVTSSFFGKAGTQARGTGVSQRERERRRRERGWKRAGSGEREESRSYQGTRLPLSRKRQLKNVVKVRRSDKSRLSLITRIKRDLFVIPNGPRRITSAGRGARCNRESKYARRS